MTVSRRDFLQSVGVSVSAAWLERSALLASPQDLEKTLAEIRANLLEMINEERAVAKVPAVELDELATQVANGHAMDMASGEFASHWGRDGLKPYQRYSFAGGTHASAENVSAADNTWSTKIQDLKQGTAYLHVRLYQEKPPYDGHRRTILAPQYTHVGIGLAIDQLRLRLVELFVAKYAEVESLPRKAKPGDKILFAARILNPEYLLDQVAVFYEPRPEPPSLNWLREARSYSLPTESQVLRPTLPPPFTYTDRSPGVVEVSPNGSFRAPVRLYKNQPGIYTVVTWIRTKRAQKAFAATEVCIEAL